MRMKCIGLFLIVFALSFIVESGSASATTNRYIGLHDKVLPIEDLPVIDKKTRAPVNEIANHMYIAVAKEGNVLHLRKNGVHLTYDYATKIARKNGIIQKDLPFVERNGTLYITVIYLSNELGFKTHYFADKKTIRIYRDSYPHMSHSNFEQVIEKHIQKKKTTKANVYLTFDDGPNKHTLTNVATLQKYNVKGTFFFLGNTMKSQKQIVKDTATAGHYIASHSMTHDKKLVYKNTQSFIDEIKESLMIIDGLTTQQTKLIRAPYGSKPDVTGAMKDELARFGYKLWDWNVDSEDWRHNVQQTATIRTNIQNGVRSSYASGNRDIVILMHDLPQTAIVLPSIIEWLQKEGYTIKRYDPSNHVMRNFHNDSRL